MIEVCLKPLLIVTQSLPSARLPEGEPKVVQSDYLVKEIPDSLHDHFPTCVVSCAALASSELSLREPARPRGTLSAAARLLLRPSLARSCGATEAKTAVEVAADRPAPDAVRGTAAPSDATPAAAAQHTASTRHPVTWINGGTC